MMIFFLLRLNIMQMTELHNNTHIHREQKHRPYVERSHQVCGF